MNIQTQAYDIKRKPSKDIAGKMLQSLWIKADNDDDREALAALFKYFQPATPAKPKTVLQWVSKAKSKEQIRYYITEVYSTGEYAVATDGHIMFVAPYQGPEGYIDHDGAALESLTRNGTFPQWERVIPADNMPAVSLGDFRISDKGNYVLKSGEGIYGIPKKHMDLALSYGGDYEMFWDKAGSPILVKFDDGRKAIIMPIKKA